MPVEPCRVLLAGRFAALRFKGATDVGESERWEESEIEKVGLKRAADLGKEISQTTHLKAMRGPPNEWAAERLVHPCEGYHRRVARC